MDRRSFLLTAGAAAATAAAGCIGGEQIDADADDLVLELRQLPTGWTLEREDLEADVAERIFRRQDGVGLSVLVQVEGEIESAESKYQDRLADIQSGHSTDELDIGDESHIYQDDGVIVLLREANCLASLLQRGDIVFEQTTVEIARKQHSNFQ